jgi:primosomal protein N' (replication factor Y)
VEAELNEALDVPVFRLDADTAGAKDAVPTLLARFDAAPAGLLLGTQMVAKGHDFPDVTLGVVLDADSTLRFPDFRAEERTFALIAQLAGRAGAGRAAGTCWSRRRRPTRTRSRRPSRHDTPGFVTGELARREALRYPPFADLIRVVCLAEDGRAARAAAGRVADGVVVAGTDVLGPAPLFRLRGRERFQVVVKTTEREPAIAAVASAVEGAARDRSLRDVAFSWTSTRNRLRGVWRTRIPSLRSRSSPSSRRTATRGSIRRRARGATPRCGSCASTAIRCSRAARCRSSASTTGCARRSGAWAT